jgi:hypothetical protein
MRIMNPFDLFGMPVAPFSITARSGVPDTIIKRIVIAPDGNQLELVEHILTGKQHIFSYAPAEVKESA